MPTKTPTKRAAPTKVPAATINGDADEPLIRIAFSSEDLDRLIEQLSHWDDAVAHRLRMRLAKHRERWG
jgi:CBS-domain-containing membrane protein